MPHQRDTPGKRIAQARRELSVTLERDIAPAELARMLGVQPSTVTRWEADEKVPTGANLLTLAQTLRVRPEWIMKGHVEPGDSRGGHSVERFLKDEGGENDSGAQGGRRNGGGKG